MTAPAPLRPPPSSAELVYDDGEPMESARHVSQMTLLIDSLRFGWRHRSDFYVAGNMFLYFSEAQTRRNDFRGPDVFVVMGTTPHERKAWVVWEEDGRGPDVVIELLSESTEHVDRGEKMRIYAQSLRVGEYFLFDPFSEVLEGYDLDALRGRYVPKKPDSAGRLRSERMGVFLGKARGTYHGIDTNWLRWMDDAGHPIPLPIEEAAAQTERANAEAERANAEAERANAEAERANAEAERVRLLEAEIAALKAGKA